MTITSIVTAQSFGTGANVGQCLFPYKLTLQTGTTAYVVTMKVVSGNTSEPSLVRGWYSTTAYDLGAASTELPMQFMNNCRYVEIIMPSRGGRTRTKDSSIEVDTGLYLYAWFECPVLSSAATLDVSVVELP